MVNQVSDIADKTFDYIVVGAGTAGLTVAGRLAEDPNVTVAVLEAGEPLLDDPKILLGGGFGSTWGDSKVSPLFVHRNSISCGSSFVKYDWNFATVPQKYGGDRPWQWNRGKCLGGSSAMNFYAWIKPPAEDINVYEELGNPGWNWESYQRCTMHTENFTEANEDQLKTYPHTYDKTTRGKAGPLETTVPLISSVTDKLFIDTLAKKGVHVNEDPYGGNVNGVWISAACLDRQNKWTRTYSATAFYHPNKDKPNFKVLTEAHAARVLFADETVGNDLVATGVDFIHDGKTYTVHAKKEVILSAGAIKSPHILELSGIGRPEVLKKIGVPVRVELPGVGENVQDHIFGTVTFELDPNVPHETFDALRDPDFAKEQGRLQDLDLANRHRYGIAAFSYVPAATILPKFAEDFTARVSAWVDEQKKEGKLAPGLAEQLDAQVKILKDKNVPDMEILTFSGHLSFVTPPEPGKNYVTLIYILQHPISRGTIHATSSNPLDHPEIDPHYFENDFDLELLTEHVKYIKNEIATTEPFKSGVVREVDPGFDTTSDEAIREFVKKSACTTFHALGSTSMVPREKNGVVDPELKVYGTTNLRVADLGVIPLQIAAHTQATAYYVAERCAEIIKAQK
ncbi:hypothetical protein NLI96_g9295 [Meripilus lineatus]|uniref:Glucose-methanol-choline oxidoreductase N-terminal domain-containing protein n=1 Tax=Meripilus lineatus TaxID=2056292 RepID=A0AAD5YAD6_9APHY|nr:hypothetical protein NLI96_g9295 [Physisporinus lineatus]